MRICPILLLLCVCSLHLSAQSNVGINNNTPAGTLHITNKLALEPNLVLQNILDFSNYASIRYFDRRLIFQSTDFGGSFWDFRDNNGITKIIMGSNGAIDMKGDLTLGPFRSLGVNTTNPSAPAHVINDGVSGGGFNAQAVMILEDNDHAYLQFSNPNNKEAGLLSGNAATTIRSGVIFSSDSAILFRAGGNSTRALISKAGDMGIGTTTPEAKLDVNGDVKLGTNGTVLASVIKATVNKDVPSIAANATSAQTFALANAATGSSVMVSPSGVITAGLVIGSARVSSAGTVEVRFVNTTGAAIDLAAMNFFITVIQ